MKELKRAEILKRAELYQILLVCGIFCFLSCGSKQTEVQAEQPTTEETPTDPLVYKKYTYQEKNAREKLTYKDIEIFKQTNAWPFAKCVYEQDTLKIDSFCKADNTLVNAVDPVVNTTLLVWSINNNRYYSAKALLAHGADANHFSYKNMTPLQWAVLDSIHSESYVRLLLQYHALPTTEGLDGSESALERAVSQQNNTMMLLAEAGEDVNYRSNDGSTPLSVAISTHNYDKALYLIRKGAAYKHMLVDSTKDRRFSLLDYLKVEALTARRKNAHLDTIISILRKTGADSNANFMNGAPPDLSEREFRL